MDNTKKVWPDGLTADERLVWDVATLTALKQRGSAAAGTPPQDASELYQQISDDVAYARKHNKGDHWLVTQIIERRILTASRASGTEGSEALDQLLTAVKRTLACYARDSTVCRVHIEALDKSLTIYKEALAASRSGGEDKGDKES